VAACEPWLLLELLLELLWRLTILPRRWMPVSVHVRWWSPPHPVLTRLTLPLQLPVQRRSCIKPSVERCHLGFGLLVHVNGGIN
jgi:hypothetical protein